MADAAIAAGLAESQVQYFATSEDAAGVVAGLLHAGDVVLVKGSRGTRTDVIADRIKEAWG
jgi:UDP-N-acetylmuramoyl-tripeptide--D-alanyl-D-alanine ligase